MNKKAKGKSIYKKQDNIAGYHAGTVDVWIFTDVVHTDVDINLLFIHQLQPAK